MNPQLLLILSTALQALAASFNETGGALDLGSMDGNAVNAALSGSMDENEYLGYTFP